MTAHATVSTADALRRFPELAELVAIRDAGWNFHLLRNEDGSLLGLAASYSQQQYTDAVFVFDRSRVVANRILADDYGGGMVWFKDGNDIQEVVRDLRALPPPGAPGAPSLVIRSSSLWKP
ncbi:hypothetical protein [Actinokineospora sp. HUAS TT18]|uniref:hypothetical protein n=1 Tax=Actinokineospora sp. HUAS TT18 TaxID=3447451 RepID=UPI003F522DFB